MAQAARGVTRDDTGEIGKSRTEKKFLELIQHLGLYSLSQRTLTGFRHGRDMI